MIKSVQPLCKCGEIAGGPSYEFCQDCWEAYCAGAFWQVVPKLQQVVQRSE